MGTDFRGLGERDFIVKPRGFHHPLRPFLHMPGCPVHHKTHAVNEPDADFQILVQPDFGSLLGDKFRLRRHNGLALCRLGQLVGRPFPGVGILHFWQHHHVHKPLDERGFTGPHRPHHPNIDIPIRPCTDIFVNIICTSINVFHKKTSCSTVISICRKFAGNDKNCTNTS